MHKRYLVPAAFLATALMVEGAIALSRVGQSSVTILAQTPAGRIEGWSSEIALEEASDMLTFKVPLAPVETGIALRDRHLREMLEVEQFPFALLQVSRSELTFPSAGKPVDGIARGELTLHGLSHPVDVRYRAKLVKGGIAKVDGSIQLDMRHFEIKYPSYFGLAVAPEVEVKVELSVENAPGISRSVLTAAPANR